MRRRRPAAATHDPGTDCEHPRRDTGEVVGTGRIHEAALEPLGQAGVGHDRAEGRTAGRRAHPLDRVDRGARTGATVDADDVHAGGDQRGPGPLGAGAIGQREVLAEGERGDDRDVGRLASLVDREQQLVEVRERLEDEHVGAALEEAVDVLPEDRPRALLARPRRAARWRRDRADRAAHECFSTADLARLARNLGSAPVEPADVVLEAVQRQPPPVRAERQGLDQLRARLEVLAVCGANEVRPARREFVEAGTLRNAPAEHERAHAAVGEQRALRQPRSEAVLRQ